MIIGETGIKEARATDAKYSCNLALDDADV